MSSTCEATELKPGGWRREISGWMINETKQTWHNSGGAIVMDSMSLEGWMGKLARLARCRGRWRLCVGAAGSGCLALVLDKHCRKMSTSPLTPELPHGLRLSDTVFCGVWQGLWTLTLSTRISEDGGARARRHLERRRSCTSTRCRDETSVLPRRARYLPPQMNLIQTY